MPDTITALATPPGTAGIAVIRLSGPESIAIADACFSGKKKLAECETHTIHYGKFILYGNLVDTVTAAIFRNPNSYTGEDVVEFSCHGGMLVVAEILGALLQNGARSAQPGEFTRRAFLNGRLDLMQVEAVADIIHSSSVRGVQTSARQIAGDFPHRLSELRQKLLDVASLLELELDFADEDIELTDRTETADHIREATDYCRELADSYKSAEILRSGYFVGIAGYPNSGKSTLFNALLKRYRAIVSEIPGTTRDYLEETIMLDGIAVRIIDTAGLRETSDMIEIEGIRMVESVLGQSNLILVLNDISIDGHHSDSLMEQIRSRFPEHEVVLVQNKIDKTETKTTIKDNICISSKTGTGLDELKSIIGSKAKESSARISDILINQRHAILLNRATEELGSALAAHETGLDNTAIAIDVRRATRTLGEITGEIWSEDVLNNIFSRFCIGK